MLNIAIIGLGIMGRRHYRVLKTFDNIKISGLCSNTKKNEYEEPFFTDIDALLNQVKIDAAVIAVPTCSHKDAALRCINKNIHLLIEKPVASTLEEGKEILKAATEKQVKVVVGHIERFNPVVQTLKHEIRDKEIHSISITRVSPFPSRITDVGVLTDLAVHDIDLIRFVTGKEIINKTIYKTHNRCLQHEDNAILLLELENNVIAAIVTNWMTPFKRRTVSVSAQEAYYEADLITQELTEYSDYKTDSSFLTRKCFVYMGEPLVNELAGFVDYIAAGRNSVAASIEDSLITLDVIK